MQDITAPNVIDLQAAALQNHMVGNINGTRIANQLRPYARELASRGEQPFALVTAQQMINANIRAQQPFQVYFQPAAYAYNAAASRRLKQF